MRKCPSVYVAWTVVEVCQTTRKHYHSQCYTLSILCTSALETNCPISRIYVTRYRLICAIDRSVTQRHLWICCWHKHRYIAQPSTDCAALPMDEHRQDLPVCAEAMMPRDTALCYRRYLLPASLQLSSFPRFDYLFLPGPETGNDVDGH